jgi:hypothetical protein
MDISLESTLLCRPRTTQISEQDRLPPGSGKTGRFGRARPEPRLAKSRWRSVRLSAATSRPLASRRYSPDRSDLLHRPTWQSHPPAGQVTISETAYYGMRREISQLWCAVNERNRRIEDLKDKLVTALFAE